MMQLIPINLIYQTNARLNAFKFNLIKDKLSILEKNFLETAIILAIKMSNDNNMCQITAYLEILSKVKTNEKKETILH